MLSSELGWRERLVAEARSSPLDDEEAENADTAGDQHDQQLEVQQQHTRVEEADRRRQRLQTNPKEK